MLLRNAIDNPRIDVLTSLPFRGVATGISSSHILFPTSVIMVQIIYQRGLLFLFLLLLLLLLYVLVKGDAGMRTRIHGSMDAFDPRRWQGQSGYVDNRLGITGISKIVRCRMLRKSQCGQCRLRHTRTILKGTNQ